MDELSEIMHKKNKEKINIVTRILVIPIRTFFVIYLLIKKYTGDYIKRPHDMNKEEYFVFHATFLFFIVVILILVFVEPTYLLVVYILSILLGGFKK